MTYKEWFLQHSIKHQNILKKLEYKTKSDIIEYFKFENMIKSEQNFCLLYKENKKCHNIDDLNCYLCACPYFRFNDFGIKKENSKTIYSFCSINSKKGSVFETEEYIHQDCSNCIIPHKKNFIEKNFDKSWLNIMRNVEI
ncbi:hypothetical protein [Aliarcobacter lanthieri]|uniref:hypothetical protein n=1 Tax=Aliarcobacter lanthieri TaxID=1355374 RepID=UPI00047D8D18|nr:hypothetical protein [Aliarcobacter lanthieri]